MTLGGRRLGTAALALAAAIAVLIAGIATAGARSLTEHVVLVSGVVLDARTHAPVAGALVEAQDMRTRTDSAGWFRLRAVRSGELRVSAPDYRDETPKVTAAPMNVILSPLAVTGRVTSAFTGRGIPARIGAPVDQPTDRAGRFVAYGIGPGDRVTVSAFGHQPATVRVGRSRALRVALELGEIDPEQVVGEVRGYRRTDAPDELRRQMRADLHRKDAETARHLTGTAMKAFERDGEIIAYAMVAAVEPSYAAERDARDRFFDSFDEGAPTATSMRMRGTLVRFAQDPDGLTGYAWQRYAAFVAVVGVEPGAVRMIAESLIGSDS